MLNVFRDLFCLNVGLSSSERNLLEKMAEQPLNNNSYGYIKVKAFILRTEGVLCSKFNKANHSVHSVFILAR